MIGKQRLKKMRSSFQVLKNVGLCEVGGGREVNDCNITQQRCLSKGRDNSKRGSGARIIKMLGRGDGI